MSGGIDQDLDGVKMGRTQGNGQEARVAAPVAVSVRACVCDGLGMEFVYVRCGILCAFLSCVSVYLCVHLVQE